MRNRFRPSRDELPWLGLAAVLLAVILLGLWLTPRRINHDCACLMLMGQEMLDGGLPYCDFVDTNPPLVMYLHIPPAWIAKTFGIPPIVAFQLLVVGLLLLSWTELRWLLSHPRMGLRPARRGLILAAWIALYLVVDARSDTGQREHLFMLSYVPYLFLRILRHRGGSVSTWFAVALGVQAGVGASLKPHFLLAALAAEIVLLLISRRWRTLLDVENLALAGVVLAYVVHWLFVPAAMRDAFFHRWLPLLLGRYDSLHTSYARIADTFLVSIVSDAALAGVVVAVLFCFRPKMRWRHHLAALASLAVVAAVMVFAQHKGWRYHRIPFELAGLLCLTLLVAGRMTARPSARSRRWWAGACLVFAIGTAFWFVERENAEREFADSAVLQGIIADHSRPGDRVLVVASSLSLSGHPLLLQMDRRPGSRYLWSFPLVLAYPREMAVKPGQPIYRRRDDAPPEERQYLDDLREDVARRKPRLIVIQDERRRVYLPTEFNPFEYFRYNGWAQDVLAPYRPLRGPSGWRVFERVD